MHTILLYFVLKIKMFAEGWVVYPRTSGSREPTWHEARSAECQVGSRDPRGLGYTTQPSANILIFIIAHALPHILQSDMSQPRGTPGQTSQLPWCAGLYVLGWPNSIRGPRWGTESELATNLRGPGRGIPFCYQLHDHCPFRVCVTNSCVYCM